MENADIASQHSKLMIETLEFEGHAVSASYPIQQENATDKYMKLHTPPNEQVEKHKASLDKRAELYRIYKKEQIEIYRNLYELILTQRITISKHLKALISE